MVLKRNLHIRIKENYSRKSKKQKEVTVKIKVKKEEDGKVGFALFNKCTLFSGMKFSILKFTR